jgi:hypothetical protein
LAALYFGSLTFFIQKKLFMNETILALPSIFIYKEAVNQMVKNYQNAKHPVLSQQIGKQETRSGWYSREQFEEIVQEMQHQNASGIRVYFGSYGSDHPEYANQLTVIFVPTEFDEGTNQHKDVIIDDRPDFSERIILTEGRRTKGDPMGLDTIGLCPPTCLGQSSYYPYE